MIATLSCFEIMVDLSYHPHEAFVHDVYPLSNMSGMKVCRQGRFLPLALGDKARKGQAEHVAVQLFSAKLSWSWGHV